MKKLFFKKIFSIFFWQIFKEFWENVNQQEKLRKDCNDRLQQRIRK